MTVFKKAIIKMLEGNVDVCEEDIETPPDPKLGDYALPCFEFAKKLQKSPEEIAQKLSKLKPIPPIKEIRSTGPFLNFFVDITALSEITLRPIFKNQDYGSAGDQKKIMVEYSSPNTNKPLHLGHVRNMVIGKSMSNIFSYQGNKVVQSCLVNDRGVHIAKSMLAYNRWGGGEPDKKTDHFVGQYYVLFNEKVKDDESLNNEAQGLLRKWERGEPEVKDLWNKMNKWAMDGFNETYSKLGISFDKVYYESELYDKGRDIVMDAFDKRIFIEKDHAIIAPLEKYNLVDKVLVRADGTTLYMTQDIFLALKKFEDFKLDLSVYVVGSEQINHFKQLFAILEMLGKKLECHHLAYGMVYLPEGRMKSREGTVVDADDIISEMQNLARKEVLNRYRDLDEEEITKRSQVIGLGALKFYMLKNDVQKDMTYDPRESISFEGETGPYIQYAYARIASILRKSKWKPTTNVEYEYDKEKELLKMLYNFPDTVIEASRYKPSAICRYLLDLAQMFNEYYHSVPILKSENAESKLLLLFCIKRVLCLGLGLLDIDVLEEM